MYGKLTDVPVEIQDFYEEEIRNESTGNMIDEEYTYIDENGDEQTGHRQVPEYADNIYVVEKPRNDLKFWEETEACIINAQGKKDNVVDYFIQKLIENDKWTFHDKWNIWNNELIEIQSSKDNYVPIEPTEDNLTPPEVPDFDTMISDHRSKEPIITSETHTNWKLMNFDILRRAEYGGYSKQFEGQYDNVWLDLQKATKLKYPKHPSLI